MFQTLFGVQEVSKTRFIAFILDVNLARAVRISGDGGQEGRHLAKRKKGSGTRQQYAQQYAQHQYQQYAQQYAAAQQYQEYARYYQQ